MMLPMILRIRLRSTDPKDAHQPSFNLYIPLLLVYILLLPAFALTAIVYAFMMISPAETREARGYMRLLFHTPELLIAAKGTEIDIHSNDGDVRFYVR